jgi:RNA polymerase sigma factor (sigma-70 family)
MPTDPLTRAVGQLRRAALADSGSSDGQLLDTYLLLGDEAAFECLVWRHGPAVLGACRRILGNVADAEDAFQATFLVLVRCGREVRPREAVGAWLYGVACNVARKAKVAAARRRSKEAAFVRVPRPAPSEPDLLPLIDAEVCRLPEKYRIPIVLCELEGRPIAETAHALGWPPGTLASRLARGRGLLARRLARHGLSLAACSGAALSVEAVAAVVKAAVRPLSEPNRLANAATRTMTMSRFQTIGISLACAVIVVSGLVMVSSELGLLPIRGPGGNGVVKPPPDVAKLPDAERILGRWRVVGPDFSYRTLEFRKQFDDGLLIATDADHKAQWFSWKIDESAGTIDVTARVKGSSVPILGVYQFRGDRLVIRLGAPFRFTGDPGKHNRPTTPDSDDPTDASFLELESEPVAWGEPHKDGIQFGLEADSSVPLGEVASFRLMARNTTAEKVAIDMFKADGERPAWVPEVRDPAGAKLDIAYPPELPNDPVPPTQLEKELTSYEVIDLGRLTVAFRAGAVEAPETRALSVVSQPGRHSIRLVGPGAGETTGMATITVQPAIAWGKDEGGVEFGLGLDRPLYRTGDVLRAGLFARNRTDRAITIEFPVAIRGGWGHGRPIVRDDAGNEAPIWVYSIPGFMPPVRTSPRDLPPRTTIEIGTAYWPFIPPNTRPGNASDALPVRPGRYTIQYPNLRSVAGPTWPTGWGAFAVEPGPAVTDGVAWGPPVDGLQFGLRTDQAEYHHRERMRLTVVARNTSNRPIAFELPRLASRWPHGRLTVRDTAGQAVAVHFSNAPGPVPDPIVRRFNLPPSGTEVVGYGWCYLLGLAVDGTPAADYISVAPGSYTFSYRDLHSPTAPAWSTGNVTVMIREGVARPNFREAPIDQVSWGPVKDGLQFGLARDPENLSPVHVGDTATFQLFVRNTAGADREYEARPANTLSLYVQPRVLRGGVALKSVGTPPKISLGVPIKYGVPAGVTRVAGRFVIPFSPATTKAVGWNVVGEAGSCSIDFPDLKGWLTVEGYSTGAVKCEVERGDPPHVDSRGISWGPVVDGRQCGIRFVPWGQETFEAGEPFGLTAYVRNWGAEDFSFEVLDPQSMADQGVQPVLRDTAGRLIHLTSPPRLRSPAPRYQKVEVPAGSARELGTSRWLTLTAADRPAPGQPYFLIQSMTYSIWFPDLSDPRAKVAGPLLSGELKLDLR